MLEAYLNQREPLTVLLAGSAVQFTNLNSLTSSELNQLIEATHTRNTHSTVLKKMVFSDPENVLDSLTPYQFSQIFEAWEKHCGVTLKDISQVFAVINEYPQEFQSDLLRSNVKTITELLALPPIDFVAVTNSLLSIDHRSHVYAAINDWRQPLTTENSIEQILLNLFNFVRGVFIKDAKFLTLDTFAMKKTDNQLDELAPITEDSVITKEENDDLIKRWRETGTF